MRVLCLNGDYTPLRVIPINRAMTLLFSGKAEMVAATDKTFHSEHEVYPVPSVVRLIRYIQLPFKVRVKLSRHALMARDNFSCGYCGSPAQNMDHIIPKSRGGKYIWENMVASCIPCNDRKANKTPEEAGMKLRVKPYVPKDRLVLIIAASINNQPDWEPYLAAAAAA